MLVLTRKKGESIMIGEDIELVVVETDGETVKLGISAPKSVQLFRKEIHDQIQASNKEASQATVIPDHLKKWFENRHVFEQK